MNKYQNNEWAKHMGINLDDLQREHPYHWDQVKNARIINKQADDYWARNRLEQLLNRPPKSDTLDNHEAGAV
jgi:hypothetical protein